MKFNQNYQRKLLHDVVPQRFNEAVDLCYFVQSQVGKSDDSVVTTYRLGREHMITNRTLSTNILNLNVRDTINFFGRPSAFRWLRSAFSAQQMSLTDCVECFPAKPLTGFLIEIKRHNSQFFQLMHFGCMLCNCHHFAIKTTRLNTLSRV